jgi:hypothetical protein
MWIGFYEDFRSGPVQLCESICRFLGVSETFSSDVSRRHLEAQVPRLSVIGWLKRSGFWEAAASVTPPPLRPLIRRALIRKPGTTRMDPVDRRYLRDYYREDIKKLEGVVGRSLDAWLRD